jgi:hypothetical protein
MASRFLAVWLVAVLLRPLGVSAQNSPGPPASAGVQLAAFAGGTIGGRVMAGTVPLPGVVIVATHTLTGKKYTTSTDANGGFGMSIPKPGRYVVKVQLLGFAADAKEAVLNAENLKRTADFSMQLQSRLQANSAAGVALAGVRPGILQFAGMGASNSAFTDATLDAGNSDVSMTSMAGADASDSVSINGRAGTTNGLAGFSEDEIRGRIEDAMAQAKISGGSPSDALAGVLGPMMAGGGPGGPGGGSPGGAGPGGGPGGGGPPGGGPPGGGPPGGFRNFNPSAIHGTLFYQGENGALDATPFSLSGAADKPSYSDNRYSASLVGSPYIPGLFKANSKQFVFLNFTGQRNINPTTLYSTVPTVAERGGDFSQSGSIVYDPSTGKEFVCGTQVNVICTSSIARTATSLLQYYPTPNIATTQRNYNYQRITTAGTDATQLASRYVRNFGRNASSSGPMGGEMGPPGMPQSTAKTLSHSVNASFSYSHNASDGRGNFAASDSKTLSNGYNVSFGHSIGYGHLNNNETLTWNRQLRLTATPFTYSANDPATAAGVFIPRPATSIAGFYSGLPTIQFSPFTSLSATAPSDVVNQTISFGDAARWSHGKHNLILGMDYRRVHYDVLGSTNVLGSLTYTGYATEGTGSTSGNAFADFLLGAPQQSKIQAALNKTYLRENVWDGYLNDDYRVRANVTLNGGLRYEYFAPYTEKYGRLVNLDHNAAFTQLTAVVAGGTGPYSGAFPRSAINPDRTMFSPRIGVAWRPGFVKQTVVRAGFGVNYNTSQYSTLATDLSSQPPFATTQTNTAGEDGCGSFGTLTTANAFNCTTTATQNNYAVNLHYRLGRVQVFNLDVQKTLPHGIVANLGYNGSFGGDLDMLRGPNSTSSGVTTFTAQAITFEDSLAASRFNALAASLRKRMEKGVALSLTYQYGHSIDNASSIGGSGGNTIAQNAQRLDLEYGNSSFDIRQKLTGNFVYEPPFGPNREFFSGGGVWSKVLDGLSVAGNFTLATGSYYTPQYASSVAEVASGGNYTLRPDRVFSQPVSGPRTQGSWFNTAAFAAPANGYGTASRNSIEGPGTTSFDMSLGRTSTFGGTRSFEARLTASNVLNAVHYSGINTVVNSGTFGQVTGAASQRQLTFQGRYRF